MKRSSHARASGLWAVAIAALIGFGSAIAAAQGTYPDRPVRIILPYGPGGVADVTVRMVAQKLGEQTGQQFVVENRPGAAGIVAATAVAGAAPDGYTLFLNGNGAAVSKSLFKSLPYDILRDFASISLLAQFDMLLATRGSATVDTIPKLVAHARANPGKLNFGTISSGSTQHLSAELFKMQTGIDAAIVTYKTTPELVTALMRGDVDVGFDYYAAFRPGLTDNQLKIIATSGEHPSPYIKDVPTVKDSGYPNYVVTSWNALSAPAGVPPEIIAKLNREINIALKSPEVQERVALFGMEAIGSTPEQLTERVKREIDKWAQVVATAGLKTQ